MDKVNKIAKTQFYIGVGVTVFSLLLAISLLWIGETYRFYNDDYNIITNEQIATSIETFDKDKLRELLSLLNNRTVDSREYFSGMFEGCLEVFYSILTLLGLFATTSAYQAWKIGRLTTNQK